MSNDKTMVWKSITTQQLADVLVTINSNRDMKNFLRDVMTEKEIIEISSRLEAAKMLVNGKTYIDVVKATNLSSRTVARISRWLKYGCKGYEAALKTLNLHHAHIAPVHAE